MIIWLWYISLQCSRFGVYIAFIIYCWCWQTVEWVNQHLSSIKHVHCMAHHNSISYSYMLIYHWMNQSILISWKFSNLMTHNNYKFQIVLVILIREMFGWWLLICAFDESCWLNEVGQHERSGSSWGWLVTTHQPMDGWWMLSWTLQSPRIAFCCTRRVTCSLVDIDKP